MKIVLMITTHFAPDRHVGAKRPTKFAKFLPEYGWQPVVVTKEVQRYHALDETLNQNLSPDMPIYRVREWHRPGANGRAFKDTAGTVDRSRPDVRPNRKWMSLLHSLVDSALFYDYHWLLPACLTGLRLMRQRDIGIIFSTSPNPEVHLVGLLLKYLTGKKWVCEFRDPWIDRDLFPARHRIQDISDRRLQRMVLQKADYVISVGHVLAESLANDSGDASPDKFGVIYNGYDRDDFPAPDSVAQDDQFTITYAGTWGFYRTPEPFLRAVGSLLRRREELRGRLRIEFLGEVRFTPGMDYTIEQIIDQENLKAVVQVFPFMPHREVLKKLVRSQVLLLVEGAVPGKSWVPRGDVVTAKLLEYLCSERPILAQVPPDGEAAKIIVEAAAGEIVSPTDTQAIENKIFEMYQSFQRGELVSRTNLSAIEQFDRRKQTATLAGIFDSLLATGKALPGGR